MSAWSQPFGVPEITAGGRRLSVWMFGGTPLGGGIGLFEYSNGEWLGRYVSTLEPDQTIVDKINSLGKQTYIGFFINKINDFLRSVSSAPPPSNDPVTPNTYVDSMNAELAANYSIKLGSDGVLVFGKK